MIVPFYVSKILKKCLTVYPLYLKDLFNLANERQSVTSFCANKEFRVWS